MKKLSTFFTSNLFIVLLLLGIIGYQVFLHQKINQIQFASNLTHWGVQHANERIDEIADKIGLPTR